MFLYRVIVVYNYSKMMKSEQDWDTETFERAKEAVRRLRGPGLDGIFEKSLPGYGLLGVEYEISLLLWCLKRYHDSLRNFLSQVDLSRYRATQLADLWISGWLGLWDDLNDADRLIIMLDCFVKSKSLKEGIDGLVRLLWSRWMGVFALREAFRRLQHLPLTEGLFKIYLYGERERFFYPLMRTLYAVTRNRYKPIMYKPMEMHRLKHWWWGRAVDHEKEDALYQAYMEITEYLRAEYGPRKMFICCVEGRAGGYLKNRANARIIDKIREENAQKRIPRSKLISLDGVVNSWVESGEDDEALTQWEMLEGKNPHLHTSPTQLTRLELRQSEQRLKSEVGKYATQILSYWFDYPDATQEEIAEVVGCDRGTVSRYINKFKKTDWIKEILGP